MELAIAGAGWGERDRGSRLGVEWQIIWHERLLVQYRDEITFNLFATIQACLHRVPGGAGLRVWEHLQPYRVQDGTLGTVIHPHSHFDNVGRIAARLFENAFNVGEHQFALRL